jgi:hypothetical protein
MVERVNGHWSSAGNRRGERNCELRAILKRSLEAICTKGTGVLAACCLATAALPAAQHKQEGPTVRISADAIGARFDGIGVVDGAVPPQCCSKTTRSRSGARFLI